MKIESSEVQMCTQSSSHYEMNISSKVSFKKEMIGLMRIDEMAQPLESNKFDFIEQTFEVQNATSHLQPYEEMTKVILERILQRFLNSQKEVEFYPKSLKITDTMPTQQAQNIEVGVKRSYAIEKNIEYSKRDAIAFNTQALIKTQDKEFTIDLQCSYTKAFFEQHKESLVFEEVNFLDPLIIQYEGSATAFDMLSDTLSFKFDLKNDNTLVDIPALKKGNGFLVLDKNDNGIIDNGSEMFGPTTNNGFEELSAFDSDGNNWIDENDPIFKDLLIWSKNENNEETLIALGQSGIGALYLNEVKTHFTYNKSVNESMAQLKSSSIFLREDGTAGVLSALDFIA